MVVADLARELAKRRHKVTIYAPEGSKVEGCTIRETGKPLQSSVFTEWLKAEQQMMNQIEPELANYNIISCHNWHGFEYEAKKRNPNLKVTHTHHGGITQHWKNKAEKLNMIAISDWMKQIYEKQGIPARTIHNGVNPDSYPISKEKGDRYLWFSRITFFKAPHKAIEIAQKTGIKLDIAGSTSFPEDQKYITEIQKSCDGKQIRFIGEVTHAQKVAFMGNAKALLVTANWGEPFGLHVVEAMMTGTSVIAIADGGIKETIRTGGIICADHYEIADTLRHFQPIKPYTCRQNALIFSSQKMCVAYEKAFIDILQNKEW